MASSDLPGSLKKYAVLIITGGSSGIGEAFITLMCRVNTGLLVCNLSRSAPSVLKSDPRLRHFPCDLTDPDALRKAVDDIQQTLEKEGKTGSVLLVNNSGFGAYGPFPNPHIEQHLSMLKVNVAAPLHLTSEFLPLLYKQGGAIVNVASTAAFQPTPNLGTYGATKAFLMNWSLALSVDLRPRGIQVLCVCPGPTQTRFFSAAGMDKPIETGGSGMTSEAVVDQSLKALARGKWLVVTGWNNKLMCFVSGKLPRVWIAKLAGLILAKLRDPGSS